MLQKTGSLVSMAVVLLQAQEIKQSITAVAFLSPGWSPGLCPKAWDPSPGITWLESNSVRVIKEQNWLEKMDPNLIPSAPQLANQHEKNPVFDHQRFQTFRGGLWAFAAHTVKCSPFS